MSEKLANRRSRIVGILLIIAVAAPAGLLVGRAFKDPFGERVRDAAGNDVYYKPPVTEVQARALSRFLAAQGVFAKRGAGRKTVQLLGRDKGEGYELRVVVRAAPSRISKADLSGLVTLAGLVAHRVLGGARLTLSLCDKNLTVHRSIEVPRGAGDLGELLRFGRGELYYRPPVSAELARAVGAALVGKGFFGAKQRATVQLALLDGRLHLRFVVARDKVKAQPTVVLAFRAMVLELRQRLFRRLGAVVELCDRSLSCFVKAKVAEPATAGGAGAGTGAGTATATK